MTLYLIGLGLGDEKDITVKGLEAVKRCDLVYLENYTSKLGCPVGDLEEFYGKKIVLADREMVENKADKILEQAKSANVAFLVVGDVFSATTHHDLRMRAVASGIKVEVIHNSSILTAIGDTGLDLYKFGRVCTLVYPEKGYSPDSFYDIIKNNLKNDMHTLCLLDIKSEKCMTALEGIEILKQIENKKKDNVIAEDRKLVICSGLGSANEQIKYIEINKIKSRASEDLECVIIPAKLHFMEKEVLETYEFSK